MKNTKIEIPPLIPEQGTARRSAVQLRDDAAGVAVPVELEAEQVGLLGVLVRFGLGQVALPFLRGSVFGAFRTLDPPAHPNKPLCGELLELGPRLQELRPDREPGIELFPRFSGNQVGLRTQVVLARVEFRALLGLPARPAAEPRVRAVSGECLCTHRLFSFDRNLGSGIRIAQGRGHGQDLHVFKGSARSFVSLPVFPTPPNMAHGKAESLLNRVNLSQFMENLTHSRD